MRRSEELAGYSGTPLVKKLGIKPGFRAALINSPRGFTNELDGLPVDLAKKPGKPMDFLLLFAKSQADLRENFGRCASMLAPAGMLWIAWPKKTSGVRSDLNENIVRDIGLEQGLVDIKVCAINDVWSGLKFVIRLKDRPRD